MFGWLQLFDRKVVQYFSESLACNIVQWENRLGKGMTLTSVHIQHYNINKTGVVSLC